MCDARDGFTEAATHGYSTSRTYTFRAGLFESSADADVDADCPLDRFANAPEFRAFKELLRQAVQEVTVAQFSALKRYYDAAWLEVLGEL